MMPDYSLADGEAKHAQFTLPRALSRRRSRACPLYWASACPRCGDAMLACSLKSPCYPAKSRLICAVAETMLPPLMIADGVSQPPALRRRPRLPLLVDTAERAPANDDDMTPKIEGMMLADYRACRIRATAEMGH